MKTKDELTKMKNELCRPFENKYEYYIATLEDIYISKISGIEYVRNEIDKWDDNAKKIIINDLIKRLSESIGPEIKNFLFELREKK